jgi:hypothetical protein
MASSQDAVSLRQRAQTSTAPDAGNLGHTNGGRCPAPPRYLFMIYCVSVQRDVHGASKIAMVSSLLRQARTNINNTSN